MKDKWMNTIKRSDRVFIEEDLRPFLQIASNTGNPPGIKQAKEYIIQYIADICDDITEIKGEINPLFLAFSPFRHTSARTSPDFSPDFVARA